MNNLIYKLRNTLDSGTILIQKLWKASKASEFIKNKNKHLQFTNKLLIIQTFLTSRSVPKIHPNYTTSYIKMKMC